MIISRKKAKRLGLSGQVQKDDFRKLCEGRHPVTDERLGVLDRQVKRICYFAQISPPKDVSIAYLVGGDERIGEWWKEAVAETVKEIEAVTETRIRMGGVQDQNRTTGSMLAAMVTHEASRALDPQLHTHVCVMNTTYDPVEQRWKSVQPENFYKYQGYFREVCYNKPAGRMMDAGYQIEKAARTTIGFNIVGSPPEVRQLFSKRREEIETVAKTVGATSQDQLQTIAARTRKAKMHVDGQTLRAQWKREAGVYLLSQVEKVIEDANGTRKDRHVRTPMEAVDRAHGIVFERLSVIDERKLLTQALESGRGDVQLSQLKNEVEQRVMTGEFIRREEYIVSRETLKMEREYIDWSLTHKRGHPDLGKVPQLDPALTREQHETVFKILSSHDAMAGLQGDSGTGKTRVVRSVVKGIEQAGGAVFACAPSAKATEELRQRVVPNAETLQQLLVNKSLQEQCRGKVIIVDEAGLISSRQMRDLCQIAQANGNPRLLPSLAMESPASRNGPRGAKRDSGRCAMISSPFLSARKCCPANIPRRHGVRENMAFLANTPLVSSRSLSVRLAIISNFGASVFSTKPMRSNSDGVGLRRGARGRSPTWSRAHSPPRDRCGAAGTAALVDGYRQVSLFLITSLTLLYFDNFFINELGPKSFRARRRIATTGLGWP